MQLCKNLYLAKEFCLILFREVFWEIIQQKEENTRACYYGCKYITVNNMCLIITWLQGNTVIHVPDTQLLTVYERFPGQVTLNA